MIKEIVTAKQCLTKFVFKVISQTENVRIYVEFCQNLVYIKFNLSIRCLKTVSWIGGNCYDHMIFIFGLYMVFLVKMWHYAKFNLQRKSLFGASGLASASLIKERRSIGHLFLKMAFVPSQSLKL